MRLRTLRCLVTLACGLLALPLVVAAQQTRKIPRIGIIAPGSPPRPVVEAFQQALRDLGYVEGQTITLEIRWNEGKPERYPALAAELVALNVDVIVAGTSGATRDARAATRTIPIVMAAHPNPVEQGDVASLARPGRNITGVALMTPEINQKRLELLKEAVPGLARAAVLWDAAGTSTWQWGTFETAARQLGVQLQLLEVRSPDDLDGAFAAATREGLHAVLTAQQPFFATHRARIAALALQHRLPTISGDPGTAEAGFLMSYGPSIIESWRHAAVYVDKILKGATPADLPVEQPRRIELILNLKTAQALGLTFPPHLLVLADKVIQ
jgi:putative tryptophan/tyrosine transport system substrate-binding protein